METSYLAGPVSLFAVDNKLQSKINTFREVIDDKKMEVIRISNEMKKLLERKEKEIIRELDAIWDAINHKVDQKKKDIHKSIVDIEKHKKEMEKHFEKLNPASRPKLEISEAIKTLKMELDVEIPNVKLELKIDQLKHCIDDMCRIIFSLTPSNLLVSPIQQTSLDVPYLNAILPDSTLLSPPICSDPPPPNSIRPPAPCYNPTSPSQGGYGYGSSYYGGYKLPDDYPFRPPPPQNAQFSGYRDTGYSEFQQRTQFRQSHYEGGYNLPPPHMNDRHYPNQNVSDFPAPRILQSTNRGNYYNQGQQPAEPYPYNHPTVHPDANIYESRDPPYSPAVEKTFYDPIRLSVPNQRENRALPPANSARKPKVGHGRYDLDEDEIDKQKHAEQLEIRSKMEREKNYKAMIEAANQHLIEVDEEFECPICIIDVDVGDGVRLRECLHAFCRDCLSLHIIHAGEAEVKCPFQGETYQCQSVVTEREVKQLLSPDQYKHWQQMGLNQAEGSIENSFHCKSADCAGWCVYEDDINFFNCPQCTELPYL